MTHHVSAPPARRAPALELGRARSFLREAREHDRAGQIAEAVRCYVAAIESAEEYDEAVVLAEALRRLSVVRHRSHDSAAAEQLCKRSYDIAVAIGDVVLAGEALNTLAGFVLERGDIDAAQETFRQALDLAGQGAELRARVEQNLGIVANIRGDLAAAFAHYRQSLDAFRAISDERGCAIAYINLGIVSADRLLWDDAAAYFRLGLEIAESINDVNLRGLALLNRTEVYLARQQYEDARSSVEAALCIFEQLGSRDFKAEAYRFLGLIYRETGRPALAEARLRGAIELAAGAGAVLHEAEASRELARLFRDQGRNREALKLLNAAHRLFGRLDARVDLIDVTAKLADLEGAYLTTVRDWGQSIESADSYTFGHCERVANYAVALARALGLDEGEQTSIRVGAYLHDVGKVRVPHEILNKPGRLTREEREIMQMHPAWGLELLADVEFPWDVKPIIRWHHEHYDGTGYPDRLRGDEIPLNAQIIGIADVYDALTTTRSYRGALRMEDALAEMHACRRWWRPTVFEAFMALLRVEVGAQLSA